MSNDRLEQKVGPYWLIEYFPCDPEPNKVPVWWNGTHWNAHDDAAWTSDANNAIRFVSMAEASTVAGGLLAYNCREVRKIGAHSYRSSYGQFRATEHFMNSELCDHPRASVSAANPQLGHACPDCGCRQIKTSGQHPGFYMGDC